MRRPLPLLSLCALLGACAPWPDLPPVAPTSDAAPVLIPLDPVLDRAEALRARDGSATQRALDASSADLRRRAEALGTAPL